MEGTGKRKGGLVSLLPPVQTSRQGKRTKKKSSIALFSAQLSDELGVGVPIVYKQDQADKLTAEIFGQEIQRASMCAVLERLDFRPFVKPDGGSAAHDNTPAGDNAGSAEQSTSSTSIPFDEFMFATDNDKLKKHDLGTCDPRSPDVLESVFGPIRFGYKSTLTLPISPAEIRSSMDPIKNARLQQTFVSVIILGNALRMFETVLRQINAEKDIRAETRRFPSLHAG